MGCQEDVESSKKELVPSGVLVPEVFVQKGDSLLYLDKKGVLSYRRVPFSGYLFFESNIDEVKSKVPYINGLKEGISIGLFSDSSLCYRRGYENGEKDGLHEGWYVSGQLKFKYYFKEGLSVGNHKEWFPDGSIYKDLNYKYGKQFGSQKEWFKNGKLRANYVVRENGRKYGLTGVRRCNNINTTKEVLEPAKRK